MTTETTPGALGSNDQLGPTDEERDVVAQLRLRVLREHGGKGDGWKHHWNLTHGDSLMHREAIVEIERQKVRIDGLMFDAFGEPRTRYVRVTLDGSHCVMHPSEGDRYVQDARAAGDESEYIVRDVWLSEREFDDLPEFDGF